MNLPVKKQAFIKEIKLQKDDEINIIYDLKRINTDG
jgi:hypothetical protein